MHVDMIWFLVFSATFSNISAISWRYVNMMLRNPEISIYTLPTNNMFFAIAIKFLIVLFQLH